MNQTTIPLLAHILAPEDTTEFTSTFPQTDDIAHILRHEIDDVQHLNLNELPEEQKPYIATCLVIYTEFRSHDESKRKCDDILRALGISGTFVQNVRRKLTPVYAQSLTGPGSTPLSLFLHPPGDLDNATNVFIGEARADGSYRARRIVTKLAADEYQHDSDRMYLDALKKTKGLDMVIRTYMKYGGERLDTLPVITGSLKLGPKQLPEIHDLMTDAAVILAMKTLPPFFAMHIPLINAFTLGVENPLVVFTSKTLEDLDYTEQLFVMGHELGHIKSEHQLYRMIANAISGGMISVFSETIDKFAFGLSGLLMKTLQVALCNWSRASELTCDRAGLLCCQDIDAALRTLMKMAGAPMQYRNSMNLEAFKEQLREFKMADEGFRDKAFRLYLAMYDSHPWIVMRGHELLKWYESGEYERILNRISPKPPVEVEGVGYRSGDESGTFNENTPVKRFCTNCGTEQMVGARFCSACGTSL